MESRDQSEALAKLLSLANTVLQSGPDIFRHGREEYVVEAQTIAQRVQGAEQIEDPRHELELLKRAVFLAGGQRALFETVESERPLFAYDYVSDFELNATHPWFPAPAREKGPANWRVLDRWVTTPFGVAASVLTVNAHWVEFFSRTGCDFNTYKTVRSRPRKAHPYPHWRFLEDRVAPYEVGKFPDYFFTRDDNWPGDRADFSTANSFGVPSEDPDVWQPDYADAKRRLGEDQLLPLSVIGTPPDSPGDLDLADDFALTAQLGEGAGADMLELNLSCPNTLDDESVPGSELVCMSPDATRLIIEKVKHALPSDDTKIIIKMSWMPYELTKEVLTPLVTEGLIDGVSGINTIKARIFDPSESRAFPGREHAGVSGRAIRKYALDFVGGLSRLRERLGHFWIIGMGGALHPSHVQDLLDQGADAVQSATAPFSDPYFGARVRNFLGIHATGQGEPSAMSEAGGESVQRILELLQTKQTLTDLRNASGLSRDDFNVVVAQAVENGLASFKGKSGTSIERTALGQFVLDNE
jgi:dihydroorotate dehydrogenase